MIETSLLSENLEISCRYCLDNENRYDLISPCRCKGHLKYVHKECLLKWFNEKNKKFVIPGNFRQFNFSCEICKTDYSYEYREENLNKKKLFFELSLYIFFISFFLTLTYLCCGIFFTNFEIFIYDTSEYWSNVFLNGFLITHAILGFFYFTICLVGVATTDSFTCCLLFERDSFGENDFLPICILFIIISLLASFLLVYFDVCFRLVQKYNNERKVILNIKNYT